MRSTRAPLSGRKGSGQVRPAQGLQAALEDKAGMSIPSTAQKVTLRAELQKPEVGGFIRRAIPVYSYWLLE